ncbi:MAG TPA: metallophosphoesterase [Humisphaera sp.]|jgi:hypothetical protein|nr:metallophosphoesterase [Humisphaera sp.]
MSSPPETRNPKPDTSSRNPFPKPQTRNLKPAGTAIIGRAGWIQPFPPTGVEWNTYDLPAPSPSADLAGLRIVHLTDFHLRRSLPNILLRVVERLNADPPDLLLLTGDFVENKRNPYPALPALRQFISALPAGVPTYAIVGNHDDYSVAYELRDYRVTFLNGRQTVASIHGREVELIGLPGVHRRELETAFLRRLPERRPDLPRIVLAHFPDQLRVIDSLRPDLVLCGHTHGGQICLPGGIPLIWHDSLPRQFARGVHKIGRTWLVVSRGLGYTGLPLRVFCMPEVIELRMGKG